jgi:phosphoadenosine phosphosulfate reductase
MLIENTLFGTENKIKKAIERIKYFEPKEGYYFADSGGKDSTVVRDLLIRSGVKYDGHYMATTIDPPEVVVFIREYHPEVERHYPKKSYFKIIAEKGFPSRQRRWCCWLLKEYGGKDRTVVTGVRHEESRSRLRRRMFEPCTRGMGNKWYLNPIIDWLEIDVWEYIKKYGIPYCELYDRGWKRIGCLGCPCASTKTRVREFDQYPRIKRAYQKAFNQLYEKNKNKPSYSRWSSGQELFHWWLYGEFEKEDEMPLLI